MVNYYFYCLSVVPSRLKKPWADVEYGDGNLCFFRRMRVMVNNFSFPAVGFYGIL